MSKDNDLLGLSMLLIFSTLTNYLKDNNKLLKDIYDMLKKHDDDDITFEKMDK